MKEIETIEGRFLICKTGALHLRRFRRNPGRARGAYTILCIVWLLLTGSCQSFLESHEEIASNLSKKGGIDYALLIGEWEPVRFAYTADGKGITNVKTISEIVSNNPWHDVVVIYDNNDAALGQPFPWGCLNRTFYYFIDGNRIRFSRSSERGFGIVLQITDEGDAVLNALKNTYSFVVKDNELIIHFTGIEHRNLLILKERNWDNITY